VPVNRKSPSARTVKILEAVAMLLPVFIVFIVFEFIILLVLGKETLLETVMKNRDLGLVLQNIQIPGS
jgi:hypothetical protein